MAEDIMDEKEVPVTHDRGNAQLRQTWELWRKRAVEDPDLTEELEEIAGDDAAVEDRFYKELEFGTGGLRGVIGAGANRMNVYTVAKATQGYANYLKKKNREPSAAIAYDSRIKSDLFARCAAGVMAANGVEVRLFRELMPTPALSFAIRRLGCAGGIVLTASHNPANYNGYKVYGADGCQITTRAAGEIYEEIRKVDVFDGVRRAPFEDGMESGLISYIGEEVVTDYLRAVSGESLCGGEPIDRDVAIVYTPLNGAGRTCVMRVLQENGFTNVTVVKEQERPDGRFPTCPYPNPEVREAMELGIKYAGRVGGELVLATDPDCDRVGIAVRCDGGYRLLSGNETGMLLLDYICKRRLALGTMPERPVAYKSIVTIDMAKRIAGHYGVELKEVLTGFKFIGEQIGLLEQKGEEGRYIFGFEESYGYLSGTYVRDKDGVNAALLIGEMAAYYKAGNRTLAEALAALYDEYGYCLNTLRSYAFEGSAGFGRMQSIMAGLRENMPGQIAGKRVQAVYDYKESVIRYPDGRKERIGLPESNVLKILLSGDASVVVRPSGTEPKLKLYLSVTGKDRAAAETEEKRVAEEMEGFGMC